MMRKILLFIFFLISAASLRAQGPNQNTPPNGIPDCQIGPATVTTTGRLTIYDNRFTGCTNWTLYEFTNGSASGLNIELDEAPDAGGTPGSWTIWPSASRGAATVAYPITSTSQGQASVFTFFPWVSVNVTSLTGVGANVTYLAVGFRPRFNVDASSTGPTASNGGTAAVNVQSTIPVTTPATAETNSVVQVSTFASSTGAQAALSVSTFGVDPCQSSGVPKSNVSVAITTATTTQIVAASGSTAIFVCGYNLVSNSTATTNTVQFEYGTGGTCGTGTTVLTGAMANGVTALSLAYGGAATIFKTVASQGLCIVSTVGTGPTISGVVTFVQQ